MCNVLPEFNSSNYILEVCGFSNSINDSDCLKVSWKHPSSDDSDLVVIK